MSRPDELALSEPHTLVISDEEGEAPEDWLYEIEHPDSCPRTVHVSADGKFRWEERQCMVEMIVEYGGLAEALDQMEPFERKPGTYSIRGYVHRSYPYGGGCEAAAGLELIQSVAEAVPA